MLILYIYILVLNIIYRNWIVVLIIIILTCILYAINKVLRNQKKQERVHKRRIQRGQNYVYDFYRYYIRVKIGRKGQTIYYFKLHKVYETKDYFYLYLNKEYSLIVSKEGFTIGNSRKFSEFIKRKCILKYKDSRKEFEVRFVAVMLMNYYLNDEHIELVFSVLNELFLADYYAKMGVAWCVATAMAKYPERTIKFLESNNLDHWTINKAISVFG